MSIDQRRSFDHPLYQREGTNDLAQSGAQNVVVPPVLLQKFTSLRRGEAWSEAIAPEKSEIRDENKTFNVTHVANTQRERTEQMLQRSESISIGPLSRSRSAITRQGQANNITPGHTLPLRKTSLPTGRETRRASERQTPITEVPAAHMARPAEHNQNSYDDANKNDRGPFSDGYEWDAMTLNDEKRQSRASMGRRATLIQRTASIAENALQTVKETLAEVTRRSSLYQVYEDAKIQTARMQRSKAFMIAFEYTIYLLYICFIYFVLIGVPLWKGTVWW